MGAPRRHKILPPVPPSPDFGCEGNQCERVFEFKRPLGVLMPENLHAEESAGPAPDGAEQHQRPFRDALTGTARAPFIETERQEGHRINRGEPAGSP